MAGKQYSVPKAVDALKSTIIRNESGELEPIPNEFTEAQLEFNKATFKLGLYLIDEYKAGRYDDKTLDAIIKIMEVQPKAIWRE